MVSARGEHGECRRYQRASNAKTQCIDLLATGYLADHADRLQQSFFDVVVPRFVSERRIGVAPRKREYLMSLVERVANKRAFRLQIENVELVDARRHDQEWPFKNGRRARLVLNQLDQVVFENDRALGGGEILAYDEMRFIGLRKLAACDVSEQVRHAAPQALSITVEQRSLRLRVQQQEIGRCHGSGPLLDEETNAFARFNVGIQRICEFVEMSRTRQIAGGNEAEQRIGFPRVGPEAAIGQFERARVFRAYLLP